MPKLTKQHAGKAEQGAGEWKDTFGTLEPGWYLCRLIEVTQRDGKVAPYWSWKYEECHSGNWLWDNTSLSEKSIGRLGKVFEAFGAPADTDTDDLIGHLVNLELGTYTIPTGQRAGQLANNIRTLQPGSTHPDYAQFSTDRPADPADFGRRGSYPIYGDEEPF